VEFDGEVYLGPRDAEMLKQIRDNTAPIKMTKEQLEQQEKFEFLKAAAIQIAAARQVIRHNLETNSLPTDPETILAHAQILLDEVWKHKGKI